jgi:tetratricopeptide (TPR) repeat protein
VLVGIEARDSLAEIVWAAAKTASLRIFQDDQDKMNLALAWIEKSLKAGESFWNQECTGRILHRAGRIPEAIPHLERALELAKGKAPKEWSANVERDIAAWKTVRKP